MQKIDPRLIPSYADHYFTNARQACERAGHNPRVLYQVFQRREAVLCGMKYVLKLFDDAGVAAEIDGLEDGERIGSKETAMHIRAPVQQLFELETIYLGLLARMTRVATAVRQAVEAANGKPVLFFPARFDAPEIQEYDGYAARTGGAAGASTAAGAAPFDRKPVGTMPHALIAAFEGDTVRAALAFAEACPDEQLWALVDFDNDSAATSVAVWKAFQQHGFKLAGVRLDTSQNLVDRGIETSNEHGVRPALVAHVRRELDGSGAREVKIACSGGFTAEKIREFEHARVPVDVYAIGEFFLRGSIPFTSDIVGYYRGQSFVSCAKVGRGFAPNPRLKRLR